MQDITSGIKATAVYVH